MAERTDWLASTWQGKRAQCDNIGGKISGYSVPLELSAADVTAIQKLCAEAVAAIDYVTEFASTSHAVTEWRDNAFSGKEGKELSDPPVPGTFTNDPAYFTGIIPALRDWRDKWLAADGYTQAIGEDLMILGTKGDKIAEADVTPLIQASAAQAGYVVAIVVSDRADSDMWTVEVRQNGGGWKSLGSFVGKSADITVTPTTPGQPEQVELRVQLKRKNANYGNLSQIATVTVNP